MIICFDSLVRLFGSFHGTMTDHSTESGLSQFKQLTGWSNTRYNSDALYVPEPGLMYPSTTGFNGSLKFFLDNGLTVLIPNSELQQPLRGLDKNGSYAVQSNVTQVKIYGEPLDAWVLGKVFLSRVSRFQPIILWNVFRANIDYRPTLQWTMMLSRFNWQKSPKRTSLLLLLDLMGLVLHVKAPRFQKEQ